MGKIIEYLFEYLSLITFGICALVVLWVFLTAISII